MADYAPLRMHGVERETSNAWLSVGWQTTTPDADDRSFERGAAFAAVLARTLRAAGYEPRRLQLGLRRSTQGVLELHVTGDVPGMPITDFESLARVTLNAVTLRRELAGDEDLVLVVALEPANGLAVAPRPSPRRWTAARREASLDRVRAWAATLPLGRVVVGVALGLLLGVLGLPRLDLQLPRPPWQSVVTQEPDLVPVAADEVVPTSAPRESSSRVFGVRPTAAVVATPVPTLEEVAPTRAPTPPAPRPGPGVLFAERFVTPLRDWPNNSQATAWFEDGSYHLMARDPGRFVAVGVPLTQALGDGAVSAQFHKVAGPLGGGYGFIIRDQGRAAERDSRSQAGRYLVLEVGDRGEVGIWQRDETGWLDVLPWRHSDSVRTDTDPNLLVVYTRGPSVRFEVNGDVVANLTYDGLPTTGGVGIFVGGDLNEAALEWLRIEAF